MASKDSQIDWAKAAAAWVSQKRDGVAFNSAGAPSRAQTMVPFHTMPHGFPMGSTIGAPGFPLMYNSGLMPAAQGAGTTPTMPGISQPLHGVPINSLFVPGVSLPTATGAPQRMYQPSGYVNSVPLRPGDPSYFMGNNQQRYQADFTPRPSAPGLIPSWLKEAAKTAGTSERVNVVPSANSAIPQDNNELETELLTPPDTVPLDASTALSDSKIANDTAAVSRFGGTQQQESSLGDSVSMPVLQSSEVKVVEPYVPTISARPVAATSVVSRTQMASVMLRPSVLPLVRHPGLMNHAQQIHRGSVSHPMMLEGAVSAPPLHLQLTLPTSITSRRSYGPPVPDPTLEADEEILDERSPRDNGGMPFINKDEPTKGLFRAPVDGVVLPLPNFDAEVDGHGAANICVAEDAQGSTVREYECPYVKVVCYSQEGQTLASVLLNGRQCLILGSNPKQAHILDSHTSVYSQHCAVAVCLKGKSSGKSGHQPCGLFLLSLGGTTKVLRPDQVSFLCEKEADPTDDISKEGTVTEANGVVEPSDAMTLTYPLNTDAMGNGVNNSVEDQSKSVVPDASLGVNEANGEPVALPVLPLPRVNKPGDQGDAVEVLVDAGRKREIPLNSKVYIQLSASRRYYLIDASFWDVVTVQTEGVPAPVFRTAASQVSNPVTEQDCSETEASHQSQRRRSHSQRDSGTRGPRSSDRHSHRRPSVSEDEKQCRSRDRRTDTRAERQYPSSRRSIDRYSHSRRYSESRHRHRRRGSSSHSPRSSRYRDALKRERKESGSHHDYSGSYSRSRKHRYD